MALQLLSSLRPEQIKIPVPALERGKLGYHHDVIDALAKHFGAEKLDRQALGDILAPLPGNRVLAAAHAVAARSVLALPVAQLDPSAEISRWNEGLLQRGVKPEIVTQLNTRRQDLARFGEQLHIEYYDRSVTLEEIKEMLAQNRIGLVSLDWERITADPKFGSRSLLKSPLHVFPDQPTPTEPLFYPIVPVVGFDRDTVLVHTYRVPFLALDNKVFEGGRQGDKAERTVVFISATMSEQTLHAPKFSWELPTAYKGTLLIRPEEITPTPTATPEDMVRASKLAIAIGKPATDQYYSTFPYFARAASMVLAQRDPKGGLLAEFENHLLNLSENYQPRQKVTWFATKDSFTAGTNGTTANAVRFTKFLTSSEKYLNEDAKDFPLATPEPTSAVIPTSGLTGTGDAELLAAFKDLALRSFTNYSERFDRFEVERDLLYLTKECLKQTRNFEGSSTLLEYASTSQRLIRQIGRLTSLDESLQKRREEISRHEYEHAMPPRVIITAATIVPGDEPMHESKGGLSCADEAAIARHDLFAITKRGISVGRYFYDNELGRLTRSYDDPVRDLLSSLYNVSSGTREPGDDYNVKKFASVLSRFSLTQEQIAKIEADLLEKDGAFDKYLGNTKNWLGPQLIRTKEWIDESRKDAKYLKAIQYLKDMHAVLLHGDKGPPDIKYDGPAAQHLFGSSILGNMESEALFAKFLKTSITERTPLASVVLKRYGQKPAAEAYKNLCEGQGLIHPERYFSTGPDKTLSLTELGVKYVLDLVNPEYPYRHDHGDNREFQQLRWEIDRRYRP